MLDSTDGSTYMRLMEPWFRYSQQFLYTCPDRQELLCYGTGENSWGVQTNHKAFAAYAVAAVSESFDERSAGISKELLLEQALRLLRFSLQSHIVGDYHCTDGTSWGNTWISVLGMERMMHGIEAIRPHMTPGDEQLLKRVMISESDWLLHNYELVAGKYDRDHNNKPESNLWNGAFLHRTSQMFPEVTSSKQYEEAGLRFLINSISIASDQTSQVIKDGKTVADRYVGDNFFDSYALNHHGYLNVGYMVICLSNIAMLHFSYKLQGFKIPDALYHHAEELWSVIRKLTFDDGRLIRIGGDTRIRYCYCQDYILPVWMLAEDLFGDSCQQLEQAWLGIVRKEMDANGDGSYLSVRCSTLASISPLYFTRLESDRAATLSMGAYWRDKYMALQLGSSDSEVTKEDSVAHEDWYDSYHGACFHKGRNRVASWVWLSAERPQGLCVPTGRSDMAEWRQNMVGEICGLGEITAQEVERHEESLFDGGFLTYGQTLIRTSRLRAEGQPDEDIARQQLVFVALPDDKTVVCMQRAIAMPRRTFLTSVKGLHLNIPNDLFNGNERSYYTGRNEYRLQGSGSPEEWLDLQSKWLNVDDKLGIIGIYGADQLTVYRPGQRQIDLKPVPFLNGTNGTGSLYADEICYPGNAGIRSIDADHCIYDIAFVVQAGVDRHETANFAGTNQAYEWSQPNPDAKCVVVQGADRNNYLLAANFGEQTSTIKVKSESYRVASDIITSKETVASFGTMTIEVEAGKAKLYLLR